MAEKLYFNDASSSELTGRIFQLIRGAKKYIKTGNFFFKDKTIQKELLEAAHRGIAIFVLSNLTGSEGFVRTTKDESDPHIPHLHELERHGVHVCLCKELHAKFLISDGEEGLIMSANYTPDSLYGNPENGVDIVGKELEDLELIFDTMYLNPDRILSSDGESYVYKEINRKISPQKFDRIGTSSRLRMTASSETKVNYKTNLSKCCNHSIYSTILKIVREATDAIVLVSWSYNQVHKLPELKNELQEAINRGVKVSLLYGSKGLSDRIEKTRINALELIGAENKSSIVQFTDNHAKCIVSEKEGFIFTANIDGGRGLLNGFELGCVLTETQRKCSISRIFQIIADENKFS